MHVIYLLRKGRWTETMLCCNGNFINGWNDNSSDDGCDIKSIIA